jgi:hypothetical protein
MGRSIAQVCATADHEVTVRDVEPDLVERGLDSIRATLDEEVERGEVDPEDREAALGRITGTTELAETVAGADLVVEAVPEVMELKRKTAAAVEVVAAEQTAAETVEFAAEFVEGIGKEPVVIRDTPGFATSRLGVAIGVRRSESLNGASPAPSRSTARWSSATTTRWGRSNSAMSSALTSASTSSRDYARNSASGFDRHSSCIERSARASSARGPARGSTSRRTANASSRAATGTNDEPRGRARRKT